ncbi:MAG: sigma factor-like helix-turn-helix DNA-binding protein [Cyanobium sp.]
MRRASPWCPLEELAAQLGADPSRVAQALALHQAARVISLDQPLGSEEEGPLLDVLSDGRVPEVQDDHAWLQRGIAQLSEQARRVLALRYGGEDLRSLSQVAHCMGLTKSTVQGLEQRALRQLRGCLHPRLRRDMGSLLSS